MDNVWNNAVSKNLPEGSTVTQDEFLKMFTDAAEARDLCKIKEDVLEALYVYGNDDD